MLNAYRNFSVKTIARLFYLHPLWWFLGVDQLVFPIVCTSLLIFGLYHRVLKITVKNNILLLILFLMHLVAFINLYFEPQAEFYGKLYIFKTFLTSSAMISYFILTNSIRRAEHISHLWSSYILCLFFSMIATVIGYLYYKLLGGTSITTVLSYISPDSISTYDLFKLYFTKMIIRGTNIFNIDVVRSAGLFQYPNLFAFSLEQTSFIGIAMAVITKKKRYVFFVFLCILLTFASTSRSGIISLMLGMAMIIPVHLVVTRSVHFLLPLATLIFIVFVSIFSGNFTQVEPELDLLLEARGQSHKSREVIYRETIKLIKQHPFIGWGTNRKISDKLAYAGSHSTYLSIAFKVGLIGLFVFILFLADVFRRAFRIRDSLPGGFGCPLVKAVLIACMIQQLIHMLFLDINDDIVVLNQAFSIWAGIVALERISITQVSD